MRELAASPRECLKHKVGQKRSSVKPVGHPGKPAPEGSATAMATPAGFIEEGRMDRLPDWSIRPNDQFGADTQRLLSVRDGKIR